MSTFSFLFLFLFSFSNASVPNETSALLYETLASLKSALEFLYTEHKNINLDAVIGTRMVEGQLTVLLERIQSNPENWVVDNNLFINLKELADLAGKISSKAIPYIAALTPYYYQKIGTILQKTFWELDFPSNDFSGDVEVWPYKRGESLHENQSDDCLAEFFGTGKSSNVPCDVSDKCWKKMTKPLYNGYSLTHELFYLEIGEQHGCHAEMELKRLTHNQQPVEKLRETYCANILNEAALIAEQDFPEDRHDLFMEQAALCGMVGYRQFFSSDWLRKMLSWQNKAIGCYHGNPIREWEVEYRKPDSPGSKKGMRKKWKLPSMPPTVVQHVRHKREERILRDGCLSHRTAVAVAALGQYIRYMLEYMAFQAVP